MIRYIPHYQPIVDIQEKKIIGFEGIIRGIFKERYYWGASKLFQKAIREGKVEQFDCEIRQIFIEKGLPQLRDDEKLFVNIARQSLQNRNEWLNPNVDLSKITLEITEQFPISITHKLNLLNKLRDQGLTIAIDDFGEGFANFELIDKVKPDIVKLSRRLVNSSDAIIEGMLEFCKITQIQLICEGIETKEEQQRLSSLGVRYMQGFLFGKPDESIKREVFNIEE